MLSSVLLSALQSIHDKRTTSITQPEGILIDDLEDQDHDKSYTSMSTDPQDLKHKSVQTTVEMQRVWPMADTFLFSLQIKLRQWSLQRI